ncbi:TonB-dependent receptor [uncultured Acinetobacter sp.]|uniref:TonB-dependent receptor n=1 Tax=uncultured Acinetobacter sp. TaxID=165433 RepID=UPI0026025602|nr:TonB-dependent receptor [uncultured Acinetobacter sp.]
MKVRSLSTSFTLLSLAISTQLYAQTVETAPSTQAVVVESQKTAQLAPIVVTATRSAQSIAEIAGTVQSIEQKQIEQQAAAGRKLADILAQLVPSLSPSSGTTTNYGQTMRGRQVLVLIDGVAQTGSRDAARQLNSISPDSIEKIEVVSGASSIYGSGATGGIINIITKKGTEEGLSFESKVGVTSGDNFKNDALAYEAYQSVAFNQGDWNGFLGAGYTKRGEIQDSHGHRIGPEIAQTDRQDTETVDVNGRLGWQLTDKQKLSLGAQYYNDEQDSDYGADYGKLSGYNAANLLFPTVVKPSLKAVSGLKLNTQPKTERYAVNVQYENQDLLGQKLNTEAFYRKEKGRWFPTVSPLGHGTLNYGLAQLYPNYANPYSPDFLKAVRLGYAVLQSETETDVWGVRTALQKDFKISDRNIGLIYGLDYENETDKASARRFNFDNFYASNGLDFTPEKIYQFGPDTEIKKLGTFLQGHYEISDQINVQAGIRHERIDSKVSDSIPYRESIPADILTNDLKYPYTAKKLNGGKVKHNATLFNLGAVYHLTDVQQIFANFSQGFSIPDVQRMLRDVPANFVVNSNNIDPIKVNNYELGWRLQGDSGLNTSVTAFYNTSDKVVRFNSAPAYNIDVIDTDERIYGAEANVNYPLTDNMSLGGTVAYTRGQFKNSDGKWQELDSTRISPLKGTLYTDWQFTDGFGLRVQALAVNGTDKAKQEMQDYKNVDTKGRKDIKLPSEIKGFAVMDVIANAKVGPGTVGFGVYNVWNTEYKTVYSQAAEAVYGAISSLPAQGRTYGLSYTLKY